MNCKSLITQDLSPEKKTRKKMNKKNVFFSGLEKIIFSGLKIIIFKTVLKSTF